MPADLPALRLLVREQPDILTLVQIVARLRLRDRAIRLINVLESHAGGTEKQLSFTRVQLGFRHLASIGFGRLSNASRRHQASFEWYVDPRSLFLALQQPDGRLSAVDYLRADAQPPAAKLETTAPPIPEGWREHLFELRPGENVRLLLPFDLTAKEATRIGHLLQALASG